MAPGPRACAFPTCVKLAEAGKLCQRRGAVIPLLAWKRRTREGHEEALYGLDSDRDGVCGAAPQRMHEGPGCSEAAPRRESPGLLRQAAVQRGDHRAEERTADRSELPPGGTPRRPGVRGQGLASR